MKNTPLALIGPYTGFGISFGVFILKGFFETLPTGIYSLSGQEFYGNYPTLAAALVIFSVPVIVLYFIFQSQFIEGLTAGAVKQ